MTAKTLVTILVTSLVATASVAGCKRKQVAQGESPVAANAGLEAADGHVERGEAVVKLTPEQVTSARIALAKVERRTLSGLVEATAQIEPAADRQARVGPRISGRVSVLKAGVGDSVKQGATLALIDSPELGRAKADYLAAVATANVTWEGAAREKALYDKNISSQKDWREAEAAAVKARAEKEAAENRLHALGVSDEDLSRLSVRGHYKSTMSVLSPMDGIVVERPVSLGQMVAPSDTLFLVMDLREVWILVDVYERDLAQVQVGQSVRVKVAAYKAKDYRGTVQNVGAVVDPKTRAVKVRVVLPNPGELKPGMFATVSIEGTTGEKHEHLFVPAAAIQREGDKNIVFVPRGDTAFHPRTVKLGHQAGEWVEVQEGLAEGDRVVTSGSFALKSEMKKSELGEGE